MMVGSCECEDETSGASYLITYLLSWANLLGSKLLLDFLV
jgi:hypothetical protein